MAWWECPTPARRVPSKRFQGLCVSVAGYKGELARPAEEERARWAPDDSVDPNGMVGRCLGWLEASGKDAKICALGDHFREAQRRTTILAALDTVGDPGAGAALPAPRRARWGVVTDDAAAGARDVGLVFTTITGDEHEAGDPKRRAVELTQEGEVLRAAARNPEQPGAVLVQCLLEVPQRSVGAVDLSPIRAEGQVLEKQLSWLHQLKARCERRAAWRRRRLLASMRREPSRHIALLPNTWYFHHAPWASARAAKFVTNAVAQATARQMGAAKLSVGKPTRIMDTGVAALQVRLTEDRSQGKERESFRANRGEVDNGDCRPNLKSNDSDSSQGHSEGGGQWSSQGAGSGSSQNYSRGDGNGTQKCRAGPRGTGKGPSLKGAAARIRRGVVVRLHSLERESEFNGALGLCLYQGAGSRWVVHLDGAPLGVFRNVRRENLQVVSCGGEKRQGSGARKRQRIETKADKPSRQAIINGISELECEQLKRCGIEEQATLRRKLLFKWHPDKAPSRAGELLATQVTQAMQSLPSWVA